MLRRPRKFYGSAAASFPYIDMRLCGAATAVWGSWNAAMCDYMELTWAWCFQDRVDKRHHISSYSYRKTELKLLWCPNSQTDCNFQKGKGLTGSGFTECPVPKVLIRTGFVRENSNLGRQVVCRNILGQVGFALAKPASLIPWAPRSSLTVPPLPRAGTGEWELSEYWKFLSNCWSENPKSIHPRCLHKADQLKIRRCISLLQFLNV